jgi:zearalenone synthase (highly reducing iterative type I polyketide synthase)
LRENKHIGNQLYDSTRGTGLSSDYHNEKAATFRLAIYKPGPLNTLRFVRDESMAVTPLTDDEVELQVKASSINFRDIMGSMGLFAVTGLGLGASHVIVRTRRLGAKSLKPSDRVSTLTVGGAHGTRFRCDYRVVYEILEAMSFEGAAGVPVAHCTAVSHFRSLVSSFVVCPKRESSLALVSSS